MDYLNHQPIAAHETPPISQAPPPNHMSYPDNPHVNTAWGMPLGDNLEDVPPPLETAALESARNPQLSSNQAGASGSGSGSTNAQSWTHLSPTTPFLPTCRGAPPHPNPTCRNQFSQLPSVWKISWLRYSWTTPFIFPTKHSRRRTEAQFEGG